MRSLKLAGVVACGLAYSAATATAAPQVLDDAALDGVVAGFDFSFPGTSSQSGFGSNRPTLESVFPAFIPRVDPVVTIPLEGDTESKSKSVTVGPNGPIGIGGLSSSSETTGGPAEVFLENPPSPYGFFPRFTPFLNQ